MNKYEKFTKLTLLVLMLLGVVVGAVFFLLGDEAEGYEVAGDILSVPKATNLFLAWNYILFGLAILSTLVFVCAGFVSTFNADKKKAITLLSVIIGFVLLFVVCWFLGSPEKIHIVGYDGTDNEGFWAQLSDMMIFITYTLLCGTIGTLIWGVVRTKLKK